MTQVRRDQFETQLRDLESEISVLSEKLAANTRAHSSVLKIYDSDESSTTRERLGSDEKNSHSNHSRGKVHIGKHSSEFPPKVEIETLKEDLHIARREKNDALYELQQVKQELEELKKQNHDSVRLKVSFDSLKQDYDSLKVSYESSERIRNQQKELISLLQQSHSFVTDSSSVISLASFSKQGSIGEENRDWLNYSDAAPADKSTKNRGKMKKLNDPKDASVSVGATDAKGFEKGPTVKKVGKLTSKKLLSNSFESRNTVPGTASIASKNSQKQLLRTHSKGNPSSIRYNKQVGVASGKPPLGRKTSTSNSASKIKSSAKAVASSFETPFFQRYEYTGKYSSSPSSNSRQISSKITNKKDRPSSSRSNKTGFSSKKVTTDADARPKSAPRTTFGASSRLK